MVWPRLLTRNSVHFPLTALGNFTVSWLAVTKEYERGSVPRMIAGTNLRGFIQSCEWVRR